MWFDFFFFQSANVYSSFQVDEKKTAIALWPWTEILISQRSQLGLQVTQEFFYYPRVTKDVLGSAWDSQ